MEPGGVRPGRNPGKDQSRKAVAWEAAEDSVLRVTGRASAASSGSVKAAGIRMPRLGAGSPG